MSDRPASSIIERVRKILSKTQEAGCTQAEADNAFAMASKILTEHNLSIDDIKVGGGQAEEKFAEEGVFETSRWEYTYNLAYAIVRNYFFVEGFFGPRYAGNRKVLCLFGTEANVAAAKFTFQALLEAADRLWASYRILNRRAASEGRAFRVGVMKGFSDKLKEEREVQQAERDIMSGSSGGTALAIRRIDELTAQKYRETHPECHRKNGAKKGGSSSFSSIRGSQSTIEAGYAAGKKLYLNRGVGGDSQKGIGR